MNTGEGLNFSCAGLISEFGMPKSGHNNIIFKKDIMEFFLCVLGMVMIIEGLPYAVIPEKMKLWIQKVIEMPDSSLQRFGFALMLIGLWLVYMGKS